MFAVLACTSCDSAMIETEYCSMVCERCGVEDFRSTMRPQFSTCYRIPLHNITNYTRLKRFKKYLNRASRAQSQNSVPETTWNYLLEFAPYKNPAAVVRRLKKAPKNVRKKCYDSLPLIVHHLCPTHTVPSLSETEKQHAIRVFKRLDQAYDEGEPFVSYLFALEFILEYIGRADMLPYINKIRCRNRRALYRTRLQRIFNNKLQLFDDSLGAPAFY